MKLGNLNSKFAVEPLQDGGWVRGREKEET